ncbi:unnamed protein product [Meganyctiphanes norvegica]|uniref:Uncharacterized protein n=1 Tax=Meganyctiphanes norvegica TaxID=48144 RepID=A0AAV2SPA7_MEGNR
MIIMESYHLPILLLVILAIIILFGCMHIIIKKCKRLFRKYFPANTNKKDLADVKDKDCTPTIIPLIPLEVASLNQNSLLPKDTKAEHFLRQSPISSIKTPYKTNTRRVRFDEEKDTYIISTETKQEGRFFVATFSWTVDTSTSHDTSKSNTLMHDPPKRRASVPLIKNAMLRADSDISIDETLILYRLPQHVMDRRATIV